MFCTAKARAKKQGVPFSLSVDDFEIPESCPILGLKLEPGNRKVHFSSPSLDKIIPELGYVKGNVAVISNKANMIKNLGTSEDHRKIADWMDGFK